MSREVGACARIDMARRRTLPTRYMLLLLKRSYEQTAIVAAKEGNACASGAPGAVPPQAGGRNRETRVLGVGSAAGARVRKCAAAYSVCKVLKRVVTARSVQEAGAAGARSRTRRPRGA